MRIATILAAAFLGSTSLAGTEHAEAAVRHYQLNIPRQSLDTALNDLAQQTGLQIGRFSGRIDGSAMVGPVRGDQTPEQALKTLLGNTGLSYKIVNETMIAVYNPKGSTGANAPLQTPGERSGVSDSKGENSSAGRLQLAQASQGPSSSALPLIGPSPSASATSGSGSKNEGLEEIVVTAQKRQERLIDVPLAVTAVTGQDIESRGVADLQDMQYAVPGLTMANTGIGLTRLQLDGIAESNGGSSGLPVVAVYLDEMPVNEFGPYQPDIRLLDMERVEILHGPQPTLYGDGAMGGTIHYVTASPNLNQVSGSVDGWWGNVTDGSNSYRGIGIVNLPLIDGQLGLRLAGSYERDGGWIDSFLTGQKNINDHELGTIRAKLLYQPTDSLTASLLLQHQDSQQSNQDFGTLDRLTTLYPSPSRQSLDLSNLVVTDNLGALSLLSSTGFVRNQTHVYSDITSYFGPLLPFFYPPDVASSVKNIGELTDQDDRAFTEEIRLSSNSAGPFNYVVGGYYRYYTSDGGSGFPTTPVVQPLLSTENSRRIDRSWATFAELRYAITDRLQILGGLRHFQDHQSTSRYSSVGILAAPPGTPQPPDGTFVSNNPRLNLSYKLSDAGLVFGNVAKGFRSGGTNGYPNDGHPTYGPETLWTYTVGTKEEWLDHRLSTELSVYYNRWTNMQTVGFQNGSPTEYTANGGRASGPGANFTLMFKPLTDFLLSTTAGYASMHHDTTTQDAKVGDPVDLVARWTASASGEYSHSITSATRLISRLDYQYSSGYFLVVRNAAPGIWQTPSRNVLNARLGAQIANYEVYLVGSNLTDNRNETYPALGAFIEPVLPTPRTIGVELKMGF